MKTYKKRDKKKVINVKFNKIFKRHKFPELMYKQFCKTYMTKITHKGWIGVIKNYCKIKDLIKLNQILTII